MAGAPLTGYDVLSSTPVEAMKKPSRAGGGEPSKARSRRSSRLKRNIESKATAPRSAATQQVREWLENLGMSEYAQRFAKNGIDFSVLPHLTDQDLKDIGVLLGHRRKMLAAISAMTGTAPAPPARTPAPEPKPHDTAERRQVTVMFSDLVGSSALSAQMDPEDLRDVISAYQKCVAETVRRFGGFVAKYMGDGVLVYFGYPHAHEDDAERAVRAGLELVQAVSSLKSSAPLQSRVGIATGLVVVGDLIGSGEAQERGIVGETPNLAARLQGIAEPNAVVIAESTQKLLGNLFDLQDLGAQDLKGMGSFVRAWAVLRPASVESRFEALHASGLTELVGREEELELLLRRWSKAKTSEGQVVLLSGEAGIGKSRLTAALLEHLASEPHTRLRNFCSPQHTDSALYPTISQIGRAAGFMHEDAPQTKLNKLDALLAQTSTSAHNAALFVEMLSLANDGRYPALELTPQQRRQETLDALVLHVAGLARQNPVLMILEDAHWIDPTSLELFGRIVDKLSTLRVLLMVTFRPEFEPPWIGRPYVTTLTINRLAERDIEAMIDRVVGNKFIPASVRQDIIERADGIPLFVEEMTKAVLEAESESAAQRAIGVVPSPALAVPASLHAPLMARLDRLGSAKEVAQIAAAIGREFSHAVLAAVVRRPEPDLATALDRLIHAGLLFRQGVPPHATYLFKHALVQDAAYGTLLREPRRALHARIAEALESQFTDIAESQPELLARHCTEAGQIEKAVGLWGKAGQRSLQRSALVEAVEQFTRALDQIATLPSTPALRGMQINLQIALLTPLVHVKGWAAPETKAAVEQARLLLEQADALGETPEDPLLLFSILYGFFGVNFVAFNADVTRDLAAQFLALAEKRKASGPLVIGHNFSGGSLMLVGDIAEGRAHFDQAIALYDPAEHRPLTMRFGEDGRGASLYWRSKALWVLGYPEAALMDIDQALTDARESGHAVSLLWGLTGSFFFVESYCGNYTTANARVDELIALADEKDVPLWKAFGMLGRGWLLGLTGRASDAVQMITSGITVWRSTGSTFFLPTWLSYLAGAYGELCQLDQAWRCIREAMNMIETSKETWFEAEANRIAGGIALKSPEPDVAKAQDYFERALAVARAQQAKSWEVRAAMSMARLWRDQGKVQQARELLAPVYGWFTEGFDTLDLKEAKALLDELSAMEVGRRIAQDLRGRS
jgi:class 3 adenylate cyclase/predicted ATPase